MQVCQPNAAFIEAVSAVRENFAQDSRLSPRARDCLDRMYRHAVLGNTELAKAAGRKAYKLIAQNR